MKKPKVAAEESIYCDMVAIAPLGPGPPLSLSAEPLEEANLSLPEYRESTKDESNSESDTS
jgi:hypothetical protein